MLNKEEIKKRLKDKNLSAVARGSGINYQTLVLFYKKDNYNSSYETVRKLSNYLTEGTEA